MFLKEHYLREIEKKGILIRGIAAFVFRLNQNDKGTIRGIGSLNWVLHNGHELLSCNHIVKHSV